MNFLQALWLSRDPLLAAESELTREDLHRSNAFLENDAINQIDLFGLLQWASKFDTRAIEFWVDENLSFYRYLVYTDDGRHRPLVHREWDDTARRFANPGSFNCHGFTFDGSAQRGGPYAIRGQYVSLILEGDGWVPICCGLADRADEPIVIYYGDAENPISHSGKVMSVQITQGRFDEVLSQQMSKRGFHTPVGIRSFYADAVHYSSFYRCYVKSYELPFGCCPLPGDHEL